MNTIKTSGQRNPDKKGWFKLYSKVVFIFLNIHGVPCFYTYTILPFSVAYIYNIRKKTNTLIDINFDQSIGDFMIKDDHELLSDSL